MGCSPIRVSLIYMYVYCQNTYSDMIELHNNKNASYTLEHNHFSYLSYEEFQSMVCIYDVMIDDVMII